MKRKEAIERFANSESHRLAAAIHDLTGWPMLHVRADSFDPEDEFDGVLVESPFGLLSVYGLYDRSTLVQTHGPLLFARVSREELASKEWRMRNIYLSLVIDADTRQEATGLVRKVIAIATRQLSESKTTQ